MFYVFTGLYYYPGKGWDDFQGTADTPDEARAIVEATASGDEWYQIVDASTLKVWEQGDIEDATTYDPYEEKRRLVPRTE